MPLQDFIDKLPEDARESFKAEIGGYVSAKEIDKLPEFQRQLSIKHDTTMANWQKDKLPGLIEEEIKRRTTKDPATLEIEKLRAEIAAEKQSGLLKERKAQAIAELSKIGLDADLADLVVHSDEEQFKANIERLTGKATSWRDAAIKAEKEKIYSTQPPKAGQETGAKTLPREQFNSLSPDKQRAFISEGGRPV